LSLEADLSQMAANVPLLFQVAANVSQLAEPLVADNSLQAAEPSLHAAASLLEAEPSPLEWSAESSSLAAKSLLLAAEPLKALLPAAELLTRSPGAHRLPQGCQDHRDEVRSHKRTRIQGQRVIAWIPVRVSRAECAFCSDLGRPYPAHRHCPYLAHAQETWEQFPIFHCRQ
jgi:hypothetical protein